MKKEDFISIVVYIVMFAVAIFVGLLVIRPALLDANLGNAAWGFALGAVVVGFLINVIVFEIAHVIGAACGKYKITSVNMLGLCFYRSKERKWKVGFRKFNGLTGETIIVPKSEKSNPKPYLLFGILFYIVEFIIIMIAFYLMGTNVWKYFLIIILAIGGMIALYDIVPAKLDSLNDGYRLTLLGKPINKIAFNELLRVEDDIRNGNTTPQVRVFDEITEFTASVNFITIYRYLGEDNFIEAEKLIDILLTNKDKTSEKSYMRAKAQKLYILLMSKPLEEARKYYDEETSAIERRFFADDLTMESIRAYMLIAGLLDISKGEVVYSMNREPKALKRALEGRKTIEEKLYRNAVEKIKESHPDWEIIENTEDSK